MPFGQPAPTPETNPATFQKAQVISALLLLVALGIIAMTILNTTQRAVVPEVAGNYLLIADGRCEIHLVRPSPGHSEVLHPRSCQPLIEGTSLASSVVAITDECGELVYGPPAAPNDPYAYSCASCDAWMLLPAGCPLRLQPPGTMLSWHRID